MAEKEGKKKSIRSCGVLVVQILSGCSSLALSCLIIIKWQQVFCWHVTFSVA